MASWAKLDLNLLVPLDALLSEQNVSAAGRRVGLSQPAMSGALARLRRHFGDDLLIREGNGHRLSPLARDLAPLVARALAATGHAFDANQRFDPTTADREFTLLSSDYGVVTLVPAIATAMTAQAPGARLRVDPPGVETVQDPRSALRAVDGMLMPRGVLRGLPHQDLLSDRWVCVMARDHPLAGRDPSLTDLLAFPWVSTPRQTAPERALELLDVVPPVQVVVESFATVPALLVGSTRVAALQRELVRRSAHAADLAVAPLPFRVPPLVQALWWHPSREGDAGHRWWRERIAAAVASLVGG